MIRSISCDQFALYLKCSRSTALESLKRSETTQQNSRELSSSNCTLLGHLAPRLCPLFACSGAGILNSLSDRIQVSIATEIVWLAVDAAQLLCV